MRTFKASFIHEHNDNLKHFSQALIKIQIVEVKALASLEPVVILKTAQ